MAFFAVCFYLIRKRVKEGLCDTLSGQVALIMSVLSIILIVYNASLRAEAGYMVYFVLALPFVGAKRLTTKNQANEELRDSLENR